jgi:polar amino acid transport system substrate-binding protein
VEAVVGTYGELVPGLLAGRWDMVGASLTITPERCQQVLFVAPFYRRGDAARYFGYLKGDLKDPPKTYAEAAQRFEQIGIVTGEGYTPNIESAIASTGNKATIVRFNDPQLLIEGLFTKRVPIAVADLDTFNVLQKQRSGFEVSPVEGQPNRGSGGAFRKQDKDLRDAFDTEFTALKKSGEVSSILKEYGFEYDPKYMNISGDQACAL